MRVIQFPDMLSRFLRPAGTNISSRNNLWPRDDSSGKRRLRPRSLSR